MSKPSFVYVTYITTTPEKLWNALTTPEFTRQYWFGSHFETDWRAGSSMKSCNPDGSIIFSGKILESNPFRRLAFTFKHVKHDADHAPSHVSYDLEPNGDVVKLTVLHDNFEEGSEVFKGISGGWPMILAGLKSLLETGKPLALSKGSCGSTPKPAAATK